MQSFKSQIKTFFNFNKRQERGAFVLVVFIIIAFIVDLLLPVIIKEEVYDYSSALAEIEAWKASAVEVLDKKPYSAKTKKTSTITVEKLKLNPKPFNPNNLPEKKWLEMGMPSRIVKTILNFETKGGSFTKKEDLQKIYGLRPEIYNQLKDFMIIPQTKVDENRKTSPEIRRTVIAKPIVPIDINRADSVELLNVPGIGPFYAGQIVKYRKRLGGYNSIQQLNELYKMDSIRFQTWLPYLFYQDTMLTKIDINSADFKTVLRHPYIDYETTKRIFNLRNKLGRYAALYQLKKDSVLSDSLFHKLEPYLKVD